MPLYLGKLVGFVVFRFRTLSQHLKGQKFLDEILSLFYSLDIYRSFRTLGISFWILLRGNNKFKSLRAKAL